MSATNLLILVDGDFVGGAETNYRFILPGLIERGWNPVFICPDDRNLRAYFDSLDLQINTETGMRTYPPFSVDGKTSVRNLLRVFAAIRANRRQVLHLARRDGVTAVISNSMVSHLLNATLPAESEFRRVIHLHDIVDRRKARGLYGRGLDWIARSADAIITISDAVIETLPEDARPKSVKLYNPIGDLPSRKRPSDKPVRIGMFARYTPWKGHKDFLDLAERFSGEPAEFVSYGNISVNDRGYFDQLRTRASGMLNADRIFLNEFTPDPLQEMADCDLVVHLSVAPEPFGRVLVEANACGVPILAYRGGGVEELFANLNLEGEMVSVGDVGGMEQAVRRRRQADTRKVRLDLLAPGDYVDSFLKVCLG